MSNEILPVYNVLADCKSVTKTNPVICFAMFCYFSAKYSNEFGVFSLVSCYSGYVGICLLTLRDILSITS